jgi:Leucine-rich repeat (LRR) protein
MTHLEELYLNGNHITHLKNLQHNTKLIMINLDENWVNQIDFEHLSRLTNLKRLWLNEN